MRWKEWLVKKIAQKLEAKSLKLCHRSKFLRGIIAFPPNYPLTKRNFLPPAFELLLEEIIK